jgi:probable rRNA maturation factor
VQIEVIIQDCYFPSSQVSPIDDHIWGEWFQIWMETLKPDFSPNENYELSLRLTDDAEIHSFNVQFRQKDQPTDVLAFATLESEYPELEDLEEPVYLGDLIISIDTATRQAGQQGHSLQTELAWLASHGLLHLLGWDHPDEPSLKQMLQQQSLLLQTVGIEIHLEI